MCTNVGQGIRELHDASDAGFFVKVLPSSGCLQVDDFQVGNQKMKCEIYKQNLSNDDEHLEMFYHFYQTTRFFNTQS